MANDGLGLPARDAFFQSPREGMSRLFPCLSDPGMRSSWGLKSAIVLLHLIFAGVFFLLDTDLMRKTREEPWYTAIYLVLFVATLVQYFFSSGSSPGYVIDAMRAGSGTHVTFMNLSTNLKQSASRNECLISSMDRDHKPLGSYNCRINSSSWLKLVMDLYPPGSSSRNWICPYCNIIQPPRSKHCHDCDRCVLQFDHHCAWLGTCIGQWNHCRFWWYVFVETILCIWTGILYITFLRTNIKALWEEFIVIVLLSALSIFLSFLLVLLLFHSYLLLTNQTTYEHMRRRRVPYLRGIPERVNPFSRGICRNLYTFCCSRDSIYAMEAVPTVEEIEARARPYTCLDIISCRCC